MPTITPRYNKKGELTYYQIVVSCGTNYKGKPIRRTYSWRPVPGMTKAQIEREVKAFAYKFEQDIKYGYQYDKKITFANYAEYALELKSRNDILAPSTEARYRELLSRINEAIGHLKLSDIRPQHLNDFYQTLAEKGRREDKDRAIAKSALLKQFEKMDISKAELAKRSNIAPITVTAALRGDPVVIQSAESLAKAMGRSLRELFTVKKNEDPLSNKTILEHHRCISMVLALAEKEMIVPYNAAAKATPPKVKKTKPDYFQPEQMESIIAALQDEPTHWKTMTYLLIDTGCRRSEVMGLKWENVDFEYGIITIETALLYTKQKGIYEGPPKNGQVRAVRIAPQTVEMLKAQRREQNEMKYNANIWQNTGFVFTYDDGSPMHPDCITAWLSDFSKRHGLPHIHPHAFRHTAASIMIANGVDLVTTAAELGHADPNTTALIYAHQIARQRARAAAIRAGVFSCIDWTDAKFHK